MIESLSILVSNVNADAKKNAPVTETRIFCRRETQLQYNPICHPDGNFFQNICDWMHSRVSAFSSVCMLASFCKDPWKNAFSSTLFLGFNLVCIPHILIVHTSREYIRKQFILVEMCSVWGQSEHSECNGKENGKRLPNNSISSFIFAISAVAILMLLYMGTVEWVLVLESIFRILFIQSKYLPIKCMYHVDCDI